MSEANELKTGICRYCGQSLTVTVLGDDPELLDEAATDACTCEGAQKARRKKAREKKVSEFLSKNFDYPEDEQFIRDAIDIVELWDGGIKAVTVEMDDGWKHKITLKDIDLLISSTKTDKKELKP